MDLVLILGLTMTAVTLVFAGRRVLFLGRLITSGQPAPDSPARTSRHPRLPPALPVDVVRGDHRNFRDLHGSLVSPSKSDGNFQEAVAGQALPYPGRDRR